MFEEQNEMSLNEIQTKHSPKENTTALISVRILMSKNYTCIIRFLSQ